jgi:prefoldin subunit 5
MYIEKLYHNIENFDSLTEKDMKKTVEFLIKNKVKFRRLIERFNENVQHMSQTPEIQTLIEQLNKNI